MTFKSREFSSPATRSKSYLANLPTSAKRNEKDSRKTDVKDSLMKFLDDCGDEDLIINAAHSPAKKSMSLSRSEHGPSHLSRTNNSTTEKRRGTKKDRLDSLSSSSEHGARKVSSLGRSEHGTPSTQKASLSSMNCPKMDMQKELNNSSSDESFVAGNGGGGGDLPLADSESRKRRPASAHSSSRRSSSRGDRSDRSKSKSRLERSKSAREPHVSRSDRSKSISARRTKSDTAKGGGLSLGQHFAGGERQRRRASSRMGVDDDNRSVGSTRSSFSTMSAMTGKSLGLDAGPFNAFFKPERRPSMSASAAASVGPGISPDGEEDEKYLRIRKERQDAIMSEAEKDRWKAKKEKGDLYDESNNVHASLHDGIPDGDDDDQPMVKTKKSALQRFKQGISKTGKVTKSTAKGTVNVVRDPKAAAKKVGVFAKDVGKETGKMLLDPKLAAKTAVSLGKDVTKNTYKVTKGVGKGVAKGGLGLTKTVAMTGVNATSMVVGTALDGAGFVVNGATGLIFKNGAAVDEDKYADYNAAELSSRRKGGMSLMERVSNPTAAAPKPAAEIPSTKPTRNSHSVLPGLLVGKNNSYDF